jgi:hypothetical protein
MNGQALLSEFLTSALRLVQFRFSNTLNPCQSHVYPSSDLLIARIRSPHKFVDAAGDNVPMIATLLGFFHAATLT